jgi:periplasmic protein CpxP/Spy
MNLTPEQRDQVAGELKQFAGNLNLSDDQKQKLQDLLADGRTKVAQYLKDNPQAKKTDVMREVASHRDQIRQRLANILTPEQLTKWDSEVSKAKEFLGQQTAA